MPLAVDQQVARHSRRSVPAYCSAKAFARGLRAGSHYLDTGGDEDRVERVATEEAGRVVRVQDTSSATGDMKSRSVKAPPRWTAVLGERCRARPMSSPFDPDLAPPRRWRTFLHPSAQRHGGTDRPQPRQVHLRALARMILTSIGSSRPVDQRRITSSTHDARHGSRRGPGETATPLPSMDADQKNPSAQSAIAWPAGS